MERKIYTARLLKSDSLSDQTKHLEFEVRDEPRFDFAPGQFVSMLAPKEGKTITRAYSIASAPRDHHMDICLNRVENGFFSNLLCDMSAGQELNFHGPHGLFVLRHPLRDSIFIATGTGIAPMRAFVQWLFPTPAGANPAPPGGPGFTDPERAKGRDVWLVYGTRYEKDIYYGEYFKQVAAANPNFHYIITLSRGSEAWQGERGYVQEHVRQIVSSRPPEARTNMDAYICGLNDMVSANRKLLQEEFGWEKKSIVYERYD
jgi:ferredoxin-NADP reductase